MGGRDWFQASVSAMGIPAVTGSDLGCDRAPVLCQQYSDNIIIPDMVLLVSCQHPHTTPVQAMPPEDNSLHINCPDCLKTFMLELPDQPVIWRYNMAIHLCCTHPQNARQLIPKFTISDKEKSLMKAKWESIYTEDAEFTL